MREDLASAQAVAWRKIGDAGTWWTGAERVSIAAETRHAMHCPLCAARKQALSPNMVGGEHASLRVLPAAAIEAIHRIRTDSGRLGEAWYRRVIDAGLDDERYIELVGVVAVVVAVDTFRAAAGLPVLPLPAPGPGAPNRHRPRNAKPGLAWMPTLLPDDRRPEDPDLYQDHPGPRQRGRGNIHIALSLVPEAAIQWWDMLETMYQTSAMMRDFGHDYRAISHAQIEMLAARVAALNQCLY